MQQGNTTTNIVLVILLIIVVGFVVWYYTTQNKTEKVEDNSAVQINLGGAEKTDDASPSGY